MAIKKCIFHSIHESICLYGDEIRPLSTKLGTEWGCFYLDI
jgi:hypothetical protein